MHQHDHCLKVVLIAEVGVAVIAGGLVSAMSVLVVQGFFDVLFKCSKCQIQLPVARWMFSCTT